jgi:hypothetical protein
MRKKNLVLFWAFTLALLVPGAIEGIASTASSFTDVRVQSTATIASGGATSAEIDLGGTEIIGLVMPSSFTGTAMSFQAATATGGTYVNVADGAGSDISKTVAPSKYIAIDPTLFRGIRFVKLVSGSTEIAGRSVIIISVPAK